MSKYKENWDKENTTQIKIKLNNNTDRDILALLEKTDNKQGTIKDAVRRVYNLSKSEEQSKMLENKLNITNPAELAREEERLSKNRARELF